MNSGYNQWPITAYDPFRVIDHGEIFLPQAFHPDGMFFRIPNMIRSGQMNPKDSDICNRTNSRNPRDPERVKPRPDYCAV